MKRIIVGITGASGVLYGVRTLEVLHRLKVETHLILSRSSIRNLEIETDYTLDALRSIASYVHDFKNIGASIASGSYHVDGMI